jgi:hypothetical protein
VNESAIHVFPRFALAAACGLEAATAFAADIKVLTAGAAAMKGKGLEAP